MLVKTRCGMRDLKEKNVWDVGIPITKAMGGSIRCQLPVISVEKGQSPIFEKRIIWAKKGLIRGKKGLK